MNISYDIVVVGAGPAGLLAARDSAKIGLSVLLVEKDEVVGWPLNCAEGVPNRSFRKIFEPKPEWIKNRINRGRLVSPGGKILNLTYKNAGFILDRPRMEQDLADEFVALGGELVCNCRAEEINLNGERFHNLNLIYNSGERRTVTADVFIAADGVEGSLARQAGIDNRLKLEESESLLQYRLKNVVIDMETIEFHVGNEIAPQCYAWIFPYGENKANVGLGIPSGINNNHRAINYLDNFIARRFGKAEIERMSCGTCPRYQGSDNLARLNLLVVGDAARVLDSLTGAGIVNALLSGQIAAEAAGLFVRRKIKTIKELHRHYPGRFLELKQDELTMFLKIKKLMAKFTDDELDDLVQGLDDYFVEKEVETFEPITIILGVLKKRPRLLKIARHLF